MLWGCLIRVNRQCGVTAGVLLESMTKRSLAGRKKIEIEIRDDFDFEAVKTSDAA